MNEKERIPTGCDLLDMVVGGGEGFGYPLGEVVNIVGDKSTGKTFLACEIIAGAYYKFGERLDWVYDDAESGFTFDTKSLYGLEIMPTEKTKRKRSETVEDLYGSCRSFFEGLKKDQIGIYVVDSLDGLTSKELEDRGEKRYNAYKRNKEFDKGSYQMGKAKFLSQEFFPKMADLTQDKNGLLIIISQTRDKIDSMFKSQTRSGGKAMDFYTHTALWLSCLKKIIKKNRCVGVVIKAHAKKSKTPRPFRSCVFPLLFDYGIDNLGANLDFLFDLRGESGILKSSAEKMVWSGEKMTAVSLKKFLEEKGLSEEWKEYTKAKKASTKEDMVEWIKNKKGMRKDFEEEFGIPTDRESLIKHIESQGEKGVEILKGRVVYKWEQIEEEIKTDRRKKYANL